MLINRLHLDGVLKKQTRQLENQRLPGINNAKIGIFSEFCKYFETFLQKILYAHHFFTYFPHMVETIHQ